MTSGKRNVAFTVAYRDGAEAGGRSSYAHRQARHPQEAADRAVVLMGRSTAASYRAWPQCLA